MALKFKLVMRKNLGEDHESIPEKVYAQMVYGDLVTFDEFAEEVADSSGVGSASVKAVLDRMNLTVQLIVAILLSMSGITLLFSGFWIDPQGLIDNSVLVAFGEISTFAGALFGVDYSYKLKINN